MTRFRADTTEPRRELFADAIAAHRERESPFCTLEAGSAAGEEGPPSWIQFGEGTVNLDCTDDELDRLKALLDEFPAFTIEDLNRPENAEGTNVRVQAFADDERIAGFIERCFREVYERPEDYIVWATEV